LGTEEKRGIAFRSSTDEVFETLGIRKLDKENNQTIRYKFGVENTVKEIKQYQQKWLQHVQRMDTNRIPKQALQYRPKGRRNTGRLRKRWRDQLYLEDQGTGNTLNLFGHDNDDDDDDDDDDVSVIKQLINFQKCFTLASRLYHGEF
jgi:hypothetical protein